MRLFVAVSLPPSIRMELQRLCDELRRAAAGLRWVRPDAIHLTLRFLGELPEDDLPRIQSGLRSSLPGSHPPFALGLGELGRFPSRGRPQVIWVGLVDGQGDLARLQARVEAAIQASGMPPEARPFRPHLTLARVAERRPPVELLERLAARGRPAPISFEVRSVCLFQSILRPQGAEYRKIEEYSL